MALCHKDSGLGGLQAPAREAEPLAPAVRSRAYRFMGSLLRRHGTCSLAEAVEKSYRDSDSRVGVIGRLLEGVGDTGSEVPATQRLLEECQKAGGYAKEHFVHLGC